MKTTTFLVSLLNLSLISALAARSIAPALAAPARLSDAQIVEQLRRLPTWTIEGDTLNCTYQFANFVESIAFVNRLVQPAEAAGHHPDLQISYNKVTIQLTTHDAGGLTALDFDLAEQMMRLRGNGGGCLPAN
jgi:4a-hydroxytetrahydrobiopterin dehydratase